MVLNKYFFRAKNPVIETTGQQLEKAIQQLSQKKTHGTNSVNKVNTAVREHLKQLKVCEYVSNVPKLVEYFKCRVTIFHAGQISNYLPK